DRYTRLVLRQATFDGRRDLSLLVLVDLTPARRLDQTLESLLVDGDPGRDRFVVAALVLRIDCSGVLFDGRKLAKERLAREEILERARLRSEVFRDVCFLMQEWPGD